MTRPILILALAAGAAALHAQPLKVYSEFARLAANGEPTAPEYPREILSPAIARNAFASFQVVVQAPDAAGWRLYIAQNPDNAVDVTLYRKNGDQLEMVNQPASGTGTQVFWMDVWVDRSTAAQRIKVEPQLFLNNDWVIYPMEARIVEATVPNGDRPAGTAAPGEVMRGFLCGTKVEAAPPEGGARPIAAVRYRNALQDRALAAIAPRQELQQRFGSCEAQPPADNPEWYYRVRDFLYATKY